jgi:hypothetical protein
LKLHVMSFDLCRPTEDRLVERAQIPLDLHGGKDPGEKMGAPTYAERSRTKESSTQTCLAGRARHDEIGFCLARHAEDFVMASPTVSPILRHRVHEDELCPATHAHGNCLLKNRRGWSRCIKRAQNAKRVPHCMAPFEEMHEAVMTVPTAGPQTTRASQTPE